MKVSFVVYWRFFELTCNGVSQKRLYSVYFWRERTRQFAQNQAGSLTTYRSASRRRKKWEEDGFLFHHALQEKSQNVETACRNAATCSCSCGFSIRTDKVFGAISSKSRRFTVFMSWNWNNLQFHQFIRTRHFAEAVICLMSSQKLDFNLETSTLFLKCMMKK